MSLNKPSIGTIKRVLLVPTGDIHSRCSGNVTGYLFRGRPGYASRVGRIQTLRSGFLRGDWNHSMRIHTFRRYLPAYQGIRNQLA